MKSAHVAALFVFVAFAPSLLAQTPGRDPGASVAGVIRMSGPSAGVIAGAVVEVRQGTRLQRVRSGPDGRYLVEGLRAGETELLVVHISGHPLVLGLELPEDGRLSVDVSLTPRPIRLSAVHVRAMPAPDGPIVPSSASEAPASAIRLEALEASSGIVESGLASAIVGDEPSGGDRVLYLRGSTIDARLVLLDGAPILSPFHLAGLVDPFPSDLIASTDRYLGGAPASYSDGVSYVLDLETRGTPVGDDRITMRADGLTVGSTMHAELPGGVNLVASGRMLHGAQESFRDAAFPYGYREAFVRAGASPGIGHDLRVTAFRNDESVRLDLPGADVPTRAEWGNQAIAVGYEGSVGAVDLRATAASSRYESTLPVALEVPLLARGVGDRKRAGAETSFRAMGGRLAFGASAERLDFSYRVGDAGSSSRGATSLGGFGEWDGFVVPRLHVRAGLRVDRLAKGSSPRVSPRVSATLDLAEGVKLSTAAGLYHQVLPAPGLHTVGSPTAAPGEPDFSLSWNPSLPIATAVHWLVGLRQELGAGVSAGLTGFVKRFSDVGPDLGESSASGMEIQVARAGERLRGWFGYGLSWFWADEGPAGSTRFDSRHLVSAGLEGDLGAGVELKGSLGYGSGLPMTAVGLPSGSSQVFRGAEPLPATDAESVVDTMGGAGGGAVLELAPEGDFLRLDLEIARRVETSVAGHGISLRPYLRVVNALNRRDALFYYYDRWLEEGARPVATRPILPLVGIEVAF